MKKTKLPPMPPNLGLLSYPLGEPITKILDAIKRWEKGERPEPEVKEGKK